MFDENLSKNIKALAYEKSIDVERVFKALEDALATAARKYYKTREPMETVIDRVSGEMTMYVIKDVVIDENEIEDPQAQWTLEQAKKVDPDVEVGGRIRLSYITKEVVDVVKDSNTQIRTYEAQKIDSEVEQGDEVHIPLTKAAEDFGRIAAQSAKQVLYQKVREGERDKVAVMSRERDVDPVGACVGMKGSRVQSIIRELRGEKIDIIPFNEDIVVYAQNSLAPAKITRVSVTSDEQAHRPHLDVIVDNDQLSLAIGKRGLNVRLAAELIGAKIDIKSEEEVKGEVADALSAMLQEAMAEARAETNVHDIEEMPEDWANTLEAAGYDDLDSVINASVEDLTAIDGVDEEMAQQMIEIARKHEQVEESLPEELSAEEEAGEPTQEEASVE